MKLTTCDMFRIALVPCVIERLQRRIIREGNLAWAGEIQCVKGPRDLLYTGVAIAAIGTVGYVLSASMGLHLVSLAGAALAGAAADKLHTRALYFQMYNNFPSRNQNSQS